MSGALSCQRNLQHRLVGDKLLTCRGHTRLAGHYFLRIYISINIVSSHCLPERPRAAKFVLAHVSAVIHVPTRVIWERVLRPDVRTRFNSSSKYSAYRP